MGVSNWNARENLISQHGQQHPFITLDTDLGAHSESLAVAGGIPFLALFRRIEVEVISIRTAIVIHQIVPIGTRETFVVRNLVAMFEIVVEGDVHTGSSLVELLQGTTISIR